MTGVVLGVGSPFGGDRVGWRVVDRLAAEGEDRVRLEALDRPGPALVTAMAGAGFAVIVDAVRPAPAPGTLHRLTGLGDLPARSPASSHGFGVAEALALGQRLVQLPAWVVIGVEAGPSDLPDEETVARTADAVRGEIGAFYPVASAYLTP